MKAILTYHSIDGSGSVISIDPETFRSHVRWLAASGVSVVSLEQLMTLPYDADALAITFDDGFQNFAEIAWPLLRDHALPATLFVVTDSAGTFNSWQSYQDHLVPRLPLLPWPSLAKLAEEGVTLGSHTRTHPNLPNTGGRQLIDEVELAATRMRAETGSHPFAFAYPFGEHDSRTLGVVGSVHSIACTTEFRTLRRIEDPLRLPRLDAFYFRRPGRLESWGSSAFRRYMWMRRNGRRLRRVLKATGARA